MINIGLASLAILNMGIGIGTILHMALTNCSLQTAVIWTVNQILTTLVNIF